MVIALADSGVKCDQSSGRRKAWRSVVVKVHAGYQGELFTELLASGQGWAD